jgi:prephenate dehydrogenase
MPWNRRIAIIGAGRMGRWLARFFSNEGINVTLSDINQDALRRVSEELCVSVLDNITAVKHAYSVLLAVPIDSFANVVQEICPYLKPNQAVMDICSMKEAAVSIMHEYIKTGVALGTHPLFGPGAEKIEGQGWILTPTNNRERKLAKKIGGWLEERGARVYSMSPREHDRLMSLSLAFPHFVGLVACDTLIRSGKFLQARRFAGSTYKLLLTLAEAVVSEDPDHYASIQMNLPEAKVFQKLFLASSKEWLDVMEKRDKSRFVEKMKHLKERLKKLNPDYSISYDTMYQLLKKTDL